MREVLFRIRSRGGDWYYGFPLTNRRNKIEEFVGFEGYDENGGYYYNIAEEAETLSEFTGLYDKNGKRIFEGDILMFEIGYKEYLEVFFENGAFCYFENKKTKNARSFKDFLSSTNCIVVGNKWDNAELLEKI